MNTTLHKAINKIMVLSVLSSWLIICSVSSSLASDRMNESISLDPVYFHVLNLSTDKFKEKVAAIDGYSARILEDDDNYYIVFVYGSYTGGRGNMSVGKPGVEVIIDKKELKVRKAYFLR